MEECTKLFYREKIMEQNKCPICGWDLQQTVPTLDGCKYRCTKCGEFYLGDRCAEILEKEIGTDLRKRSIISNTIREGGIKKIASRETVDLLLNAKDLPVPEKLNRLLLELSQESKFVGDWLSDDQFLLRKRLIAAWAMNIAELEGMIDVLLQQAVLEKNERARTSRESRAIRLTGEGWQLAAKSSTRQVDSAQCFIAMGFKNAPDIHSDIRKAITETGWNARRVDDEPHHDNKICDEIVRQIRASRFMVADLTGANAGAYYEAGLAHGLNMPIIWTCKKDENLHFDIRQYFCIFWEADKLDHFVKELKAAIEARIGRGPRWQEFNP